MSHDVCVRRLNTSGSGPHAVTWTGLVLVCLLATAGIGFAQEEATPAQSFSKAAALGPVIEARSGAVDVLDLPGCVNEALRANDALRAERLRMEELHGQMNQALATGLPTLDLVGDWTRSRDPSMALDSTFGGGGTFAPPVGAPDWFNQWLGGFGSLIPEAEAIPAQSFLRANLNLNWTINPVKIAGAVGAARLGIDRQQQTIDAAANETAETTIEAYYSIIKAAEQIRAVEAELANQTEFLDIMKMRFEMGLATRLDTLQAAVNLANIEPELSIAEADLRNQGARLNALMGRAPEAPLSISNQQEVETGHIDRETALAMAQRRPDLTEVELFTDMLRRNRQAQKAENLPYLTVGAGYGYVGKTFDSVFDKGHDSWRASLAVNVPIFDGMLNRGLVAETDAQIRRTEAELSGSRRDVQVEVLETLANLERARKVLAAVELNLVRSEEALDESLLMLELGKIDYVDVLVSEASRVEARSNVIDARYEVLILTAALKRAIGWSPLVSLDSIPGLLAEVSR